MNELHPIPVVDPTARFVVVGHDPLEYSCRCSQQAAVAAVNMLGPEVIEAVHSGETETVTCEFCGSQYEVNADSLSVH